MCLLYTRHLISPTEGLRLPADTQAVEGGNYLLPQTLRSLHLRLQTLESGMDGQLTEKEDG